VASVRRHTLRGTVVMLSIPARKHQFALALSGFQNLFFVYED
jgi:hypothetical protein